MPGSRRRASLTAVDKPQTLVLYSCLRLMKTTRALVFLLVLAVVAGAGVGGHAPVPGAPDGRPDRPGGVDAGGQPGAGRGRDSRPRKRAVDVRAHADAVRSARRVAAGARSGAHDVQRRPGQIE